MAKPRVDAEYLKEIEKARRDLRALISNRNCAPLMLRLAWHDAGTYDAKTNTGGPNGSIRNRQELNHAANKGLETALAFCEEVKAKHPKISYADLYQLAGVVAVEVTGGPTINFVPGRKDSLESPAEGRLPDAKQGESKDLLKLPTDKALVEDPNFRKYVELYAKDEDAFFSDYATSHKKLSELGFIFKNHRSILAKGVIGIAIVLTAVILGYLRELNKKTN
ncbi:putative L-ascorbate peroxidase 3, peroxisomal [Glycine max]|nr:putative L-ascorbate peroxidase 3, peroxisomal [Glycine max]